MNALNLPTQPTPFIGREKELAQIGRRLTDPACRLITLVGPGGIGKTRLAVQIANRVLSHFPHGTFFVPLASLTSPDYLISTIANVLHFPFQGDGDPRQQLLGFVADKALLLVLDNFEHLLAGANLVREMLEAAPQTKILITSRETLNLQQEWVWHIDGLDFPESEQTASLESYGAIQLFAECASHVQAGFSLEINRLNVLQICQLVQGIPLAIELAAAWLKTLSCEDVVTEIRRNLDFLSSPLRDVPDRHRSIRAVFAWSWLLLTEEERVVYRRLTVFRGGFRRQAAEAISGAHLPILSALVGKSLVKRNDSGRYEIHELLRQYGQEQLADAGEMETTLSAHCLFFAEFLRQREADLKGKRQLAALNEIEADFENIRAAWTRAALQKLGGVLVDSMESLFLFCDMRSRFHEGRELFEFAVKITSSVLDWGFGTISLNLLARRVRTEVLGYLIHRDAARNAIIECLEGVNGRDDLRNVAFCQLALGEIDLFTGDKATAIRYFEPALSFYQQEGDKFYQARILQRLGMCYFETHPDLFAELAQNGFELSREVGDRIGMANCLYNLGSANSRNGHLIECEHQYLQALAIRREVGDLANISVNASGVAHSLINRGDFEGAATMAREGLDIATRIGHVDGQNFALIELGALAILREDYTYGKQLCQEGRDITTRIAISPLRTALTDVFLAMAACGLGDYRGASAGVKSGLEFSLNTGHLELLKWGLSIAAVIKAHDGRPDQAAELLALACHSPAEMQGWMDKSPLFIRLRADLEQHLGSDAYKELWERGSAETVFDITAVLERYQLLPATVVDITEQLSKRADGNRDDKLTERELELIYLIAAGLSNQEISERLFIEMSTVKKHVNHIFSKLGVASRTMVIVRARDLKLI